MKSILYSCLALAASFAFFSCSSYKPKSNQDAHNTESPTAVVAAHLRALEAGDWDKANSYLADNYKMKMQGMPFFVSIPKSDALLMHKARKTAFPDFKFNEKTEWQRDNQVKIAVYLTGTHTGLLDYPKNVGVPRTEPTGKTINLPSEYFVYSVENNKIVDTYGEIPEGHGPTALKKQLGIEK
jgi:predicted ester cyclase